MILLKRTLCALLLWVSTGAFGLSYYGEAVDGWRPRCVSTGTKTNLFLTWNETEFIERKIWARRRDMPCSQWRQAWGWSVRPWTLVNPHASHAYGIRLGRDTEIALEQVRYGTKVVRFETTAEEWLRNNPIATYTFGINRWLTKTHGLGFASGVYRAWTDAKPENQRLRALFKRMLQTIPGDARAGEDLAKRFPNVRVLVSLGMGWDPKTAPPDGSIGIFLRETSKLGFPVIHLRNYPDDDVRGNVGILREQLDRELAKGHDIILMGLCKGSPELLAALALATRPYQTADRKQSAVQGRGRVLGYANLSGLLWGTYLSDRLKSIPHNEFIAPILQELGGAKGKEFSILVNQLQTMDRVSMARFNKLWVNKVPSDVIYVTAVGVSSAPTGFRSSEDPFTVGMRRRAQGLGFIRAANDGYIDYPGSELPEGTGTQQYTITFDSTHMLWDGKFDNIPLNSTEMRRAMFLGLFTILLEMK